MPGHEYPIPRVTAQKNLLPVGIEPGTSRSEVRLTNHLASRTGRVVGLFLTPVVFRSCLLQLSSSFKTLSRTAFFAIPDFVQRRTANPMGVLVIGGLVLR